MSITETTIALIPARMASTRLPGKPLANIGGKPMIVHVVDRARDAGFSNIAVATDSTEIATAVDRYGATAVMTGDHHTSGSDRIFEALEKCDPKRRVDTIVNVQGDLPTIDPAALIASIERLKDPVVDISTLAAEITNVEERTNPNVVKAILSGSEPAQMRALYFTRATAPFGEGPLYHHIGLYAYRRSALERFINLPPSPLEQREKLEQLRALEAGMQIGVAIVDTIPLGVDTPADLEQARAQLSSS
ncbi:MAG: 3-deoxy-manno-octulosonate cytidylyltransferase [Pseudomonadota bacterium]